MGGTVELKPDGGRVSPSEGRQDPMLGRQLLHYRVIDVIGQGGMSVVYRGRDERLLRDVAIKVLHPFLAQKAECRERLAREARAVARLEHPNILKIFDYSDASVEQAEEGRGATGGDGFLVMELVAGTTLKAFAEQHQVWRVPEVGCLVGFVLARALAHAHEQGVVHRDLKPENVMVRDDGVLKLMDFGIAHVVDQKQLTITGTLIGSPAHMAPECIEGFPADARSDVFSLGTVLYWLTTGRLPFEAPSPHALLRAIAETRYPPPQQCSPRVSDELAKFLDRALARQPQDRFASAGEMAGALAALLHNAGATPTDEEVQAVLADPGGRFPEVEEAVCRAYLHRADALLEQQSIAKALGALSRVLATRPDDPEASRLLEQAHGAEEEAEPRSAEGAAGLAPAPTAPAAPLGPSAWAKLMLFGVVVALLLTAVGVARWVDAQADPTAALAAGRQLESEAKSDRAGTPAGAAAAMGEATAAAADPVRGRNGAGVTAMGVMTTVGQKTAPRAPVDGGAGRPTDERRPSQKPVLVPMRALVGRGAQKPPVRVAPTRTLDVFVWPFADIFLDGKKVAAAKPRIQVPVRPGRHLLRFEHPHAKSRDEWIDVPKEGGELEVRVRLDQAKPAYLMVEAVPPDAEIAVDGVPKGKASESLASPIVVPFKVLAAKNTLEVMVLRPGFQTYLQRQEFEAGKTARVRVVLQPLRDDEGASP